MPSQNMAMTWLALMESSMRTVMNGQSDLPHQSLQARWAPWMIIIRGMERHWLPTPTSRRVDNRHHYDITSKSDVNILLSAPPPADSSCIASDDGVLVFEMPFGCLFIFYFFLSFFSHYSILHSAHLRPMHIVLMLFSFGCSGSDGLSLISDDTLGYACWLYMHTLVESTDSYRSGICWIPAVDTPSIMLIPVACRNPTSETCLFYICVTVSCRKFLACRCWRHSLYSLRSNAAPCDGGHLFFTSTCLSLRGLFVVSQLESNFLFIRWLDYESPWTLF